MKYTYVFSGAITVDADSEEEAFEKASDLTAPTWWASDHCDHITVDNMELVETDEDEVD